MAQTTQLTVYGLPGMVQTFVAKAAALLITVPADRIFAVEGETRIYPISREIRIFAIEDDGRTKAIL